MREIRSSGSVRGVRRNPYPYRDYDFLGARSPHHLHRFVLAVFDQLLIVVVEIEGGFSDGNAEMIFFFRQLHAVIRMRQNLSEKSETRPVVVIHHDAPHPPSPCAFCSHHLPGKCHGQRTHRLDRKPTRKTAFWISLIELFGQGMCRGRFVHADQFLETSEHNIAGLRHQVAAHTIAGISESALKSRTSGIE